MVCLSQPPPPHILTHTNLCHVFFFSVCLSVYFVLLADLEGKHQFSYNMEVKILKTKYYILALNYVGERMCY